MSRNQDRSTFREFAPNCQHFKGFTIFLGRFRSRRLYNVLVSTDLPDARRLASGNINDVRMSANVSASESSETKWKIFHRSSENGCVHTIKFILNYISRMTGHISRKLWTLGHVKFNRQKMWSKKIVAINLQFIYVCYFIFNKFFTRVQSNSSTSLSS